MIRLENLPLSAETQTILTKLQDTVNQSGDYAKQVASAKSAWDKDKYLKDNKPAFFEIKAQLDKMCQGARRCCYCEDSAADEIEHVRPKSLYPESTFVWMNYLYTCGPCNGTKRAYFAIFAAGSDEEVNVSRKRNDPVVPPVPGDPLFIDPRTENPLEFMRMDILSTFTLWPRGTKGTRNYRRAEYTIDVLELKEGKGGILSRARRQAYRNYKARLKELIDQKEAPDFDRDLALFQQMDHRMVWEEMKRSHGRIPELKVLFEAAPEALNW